MTGKPWSEGTAKAFWNAILCDSSWHGIHRTDLWLVVDPFADRCVHDQFVVPEDERLAAAFKVVAYDLNSLAKRYRERGMESEEVLDSAAMQAKVAAWRQGMWR